MNDQIKHEIRSRDGFRCIQCGMTNDASIERWGRSLEVHRIDPVGLYSLENCQTLCKVCHGGRSRKPVRQTRIPRPRPAPIPRAPRPRIVRRSVVFRIPAGEKAQWIAFARTLGLSLPDYIRVACNEQMSADQRATAAREKAICALVNRAKSTMTNDEFIALCYEVIRHHEQKS